MVLSFTVDVEMDLGSGPTHEGLDRGLPFILSLLKEHGVRGTFFINGLSLSYLRAKGLLDEIVSGGHEVASHGSRHVDYRRISEEEALKELLSFKEELERVTGTEVVGFRAPQFRIDVRLIKLLKEAGFKYDSSLPEAGCLSAASLLRKVKASKSVFYEASKYLKEFPVSCLPVVRIPHGLLWISKVGFSLYSFLFKLMKDREFSAVFYVHPYDLVGTRKESRVKFKGLLQKSFYRVNLSNPKALLSNLLKFWKGNGVSFVPLKELLVEGT